MTGAATPVARRFVAVGDAMLSAAKESARDRLLADAFEDTGVPAREDVGGAGRVGGNDDMERLRLEMGGEENKALCS